MALKRTRYLIELDGDPTTHELTILPADQIVAESAGPRFGHPSIKAAPITYQFLWMWAAARRQGVFTGEWPAFKAALVAYDDPDQAGDEAGEDPREDPREDLDPTPPAGSTS